MRGILRLSYPAVLNRGMYSILNKTTYTIATTALNQQVIQLAARLLGACG